MPDYVLEPPDLVLVEVLEALPGRPISGERLVRPDGKISLGFYGEVYVAGSDDAGSQGKDRSSPSQVPHRRAPWAWSSSTKRASRRSIPKTKKPKLIDPKDSADGLRRRHGLQQQELLCPGRRADHRQAADHGQ